jgi:hypothetical protein
MGACCIGRVIGTVCPVCGQRVPSNRLRREQDMAVNDRTADIDNRFRYHPPTPEAIAKHEMLRDAHRQLAHLVLETVPAGRHQSLALTALQEALMWANAAVACDTPQAAT